MPSLGFLFESDFLFPFFRVQGSGFIIMSFIFLGLLVGFYEMLYPLNEAGSFEGCFNCCCQGFFRVALRGSSASSFEGSFAVLRGAFLNIRGFRDSGVGFRISGVRVLI